MSNPRPTPTLYRAALNPTETVKTPVKPVIPSADVDSFGFDAAIPVETVLAFSSERQPLDQVLSTWRAQIANEDLRDVEIAHYRTATTDAPRGLYLRATDGALMRKTGGTPQAYTPRAWGQLVGLLLQEVANKPRGAAEPFRWLSPGVRSEVFAEMKGRSERSEGAGHEVLLRSYRHASGQYALRAVLSGRHSGVHFDDLALSHVLEGFVNAKATAFVRRGVDETRGYVVLDEASDEVNVTLSFRNSETGAASLGFSGGCHVRVLDATICDAPVSVEIADESTSTRRAHTLPRARKTFEERAAIASERMLNDLNEATAEAMKLCEAWRVALETFAPNFETVDKSMGAEVILDLIEENTRGFKPEDRAELTVLFTTEEALKAIPWGSAAYISGAWAILARKASSFAEHSRLQAEAVRWLRKPFAVR